MRDDALVVVETLRLDVSDAHQHRQVGFEPELVVSESTAHEGNPQ
jgi:hypothetical protein